MAEGCYYNLLTDPLIGVRHTSGAVESLSLPEVLSRLGAGDEIEYTALQPHQHHAWHAFLCQLAALAVHRADNHNLDLPPPEWRNRIVALTSGQEEPWCLVVEDLAQPAFLQTPVPEGDLATYKRALRSPDELDLLVTTRNHDVKIRRVRAPLPQHWIFALISLQTMEGYHCPGNYGISRMNSGYSCRPCVTLAPGLRWGERFLRDVPVLLRHRDEVVTLGLPGSGGRALLWLEPWDGVTSLPVAECDPFYVEVCRRIRLAWHGDALSAQAATTKGRRLDAEQWKGDTGDPWIPVRREDGAALNVSAKGFSYNLVQELLFGGDYRPGAALRRVDLHRREEVFVGQALARGQGKTQGVHERVLPIPKPVRRLLASPTGSQQLGALAKRQVEIAATVRRQILHPALCALLQAGSERLDFRDSRTQRWLQDLDARVDGIFFPHLWSSLDRDPGEVEVEWAAAVVRQARDILGRAEESCPLPTLRRYPAMAAAEGMFNGLAERHFPGWRNTPGEPQ